jgi:hypothetical protein
VWDWDQQDDQHGSWVLAHSVSVAELLRRNPEANAFMDGRKAKLLSPLGFHPTDEDVVFLEVAGAMAAYSIESGALTLLSVFDHLLLEPRDVFPYEHPHYPVDVPAVKSSGIPESPGLPTPELLVL